MTRPPLPAAGVETRFARWLVRGSRRSRARTIAVALFAAAWLSLTVTGSFLGSNQTGIGGRIGDAAYNALTFLAPRDGYGGVGKHESLPPLLWWGRFFGVGLSMLALVWAALHRSRNLLAGFLIRSRARGHMLVFSADGFADALAREAAEAGQCVVLVERGVSGDRIMDLGRSGVIVMPEATTPAEGLRDCRIGHAAVAIAWMDRDSLSLSSAFAARQAMQRADGEIIVRIDSAEMQRSLRAAPEMLQTDEGRLRSVSPTIQSVRAALSGPDLVRGALDHRRERVDVMLHGSTRALGVIASTILRHNWSAHLGPPQVVWNLADQEQIWQDWCGHHYCFLEHVKTVFGEEEAPSITTTRRHAAPDLGAISAHIVDEEDDDRTLAAAFDLAARLAQEADRPIPVQAVLRSAHAVRELLDHSRTLAFARPILIGANTSFLAFVPFMGNASGAEIHEAYVRMAAGQPDTARDWQHLAETYVHANSAASDHSAIKDFDIAHALGTGADMAAVIERLAITEHHRWAVERLLDGWAPAAVRNNDRRLHDKLVPWRTLPQADREKDMLSVKLALDRSPAPTAQTAVTPIMA